MDFEEVAAYLEHEQGLAEPWAEFFAWRILSEPEIMSPWVNQENALRGCRR